MTYTLKNADLNELMQKTIEKNPSQNEFYQAVYEFMLSVEAILDIHPELIDKKVIERILEPERQVMFRVAWVDDKGEIQVNRGYRIQIWQRFEGNS